MKSNRISVHWVLKNFAGKLLMIFLFLFLSQVSKSQDISLTAIGNLKGPPAELKLTELKSIFMGEKQRWRDGTKISIALLKTTNNQIGQSICKKFYDMSGDELSKMWLALLFQGKASAPSFFNSVNELKEFVAQNPGAIGIINQVPASTDVKTVKINGKTTF